MKRITLAMMALLLMALPSSAQNYKNSRYYNPKTGHLDYRFQHSGNAPYFGFRIGPSFSYVNSDDSRLDGGNWQTGLNVGVLAGIPLSDQQPLYLEVGVNYTEKGGKKDLTSGKKMTYDLNYLEVPLVLKYKCYIDDNFSVQPFVGGYLAAGAGGKIKNFEEREVQNSFSQNNFKRFDGGLRLGCGIQYDLFYAELGYDIGLSNICHDTFDKSKNGCLQLNFGVNF